MRWEIIVIGVLGNNGGGCSGGGSGGGSGSNHGRGLRMEHACKVTNHMCMPPSKKKKRAALHPTGPFPKD